MPVPALNAREPLLTARGIERTFVRSAGWLRPAIRRPALRGVDVDLMPGEILGVVGESGCGKSTLARIVVGLEGADAGRIELGGTVLVDAASGVSLAPSRRRIQMIFQDPYSSLNPRLRVRDIVGEGLAIAGVPARLRLERVAAVLHSVGLKPSDGERYAHQFSGGQRQRIGIARALVMEPALLIADEAVSALDVSVQMQILNLILDVRERFGITVLFITHDIGVVEYLCDRVVVLSAGSVVESGPTSDVMSRPADPYTRKLIASVPRLMPA